ncbi:MAG: TetR/AcrR family transcriptional regulator [Bacteroidetes bacterium]|nr:TetR/AcrR family transcriptional regulator [Bacteroidota bacterium]
MSNKEIQEARMRSYFIEATKELLKGEGLKSVSVRNIAEKAGYSYATIYNYFRDVKELVFICVKDFQEECAEFVQVETQTEPHGAGKLKAMYMAYIRYFIQYPGIFELFFLERLSDISSGMEAPELIYYFLDRLTEKDWKILTGESMIDEETASRGMSEMNMMISGLMLFYLNRHMPPVYEEFISRASQLISGAIDNYIKIGSSPSGGHQDNLWSY